jgi:hypothetical protein
MSIFIEQKVKVMEKTMNEMKAQLEALQESFKSLNTAPTYDFRLQNTAQATTQTAPKTKVEKKWKNETSAL